MNLKHEYSDEQHENMGFQQHYISTRNLESGAGKGIWLLTQTIILA
jgi:hypothetical protein